MTTNKMDQNKNKNINSIIYRSAIEKSLYLAISTRPDILFSVGKADRKSDNPTKEDMANILKIIRYLINN